MKQITSTQNPLFKHWLKLQRENGYRQEQKSLFLEGKKLVLEALERGLAQELIINESHSPFESHSTIILKEHLSLKLSSLKNPEGYFAEVQRPENACLVGKKQVLVLDGVQDPGNVGTLIRTALAFGFEGIFMTPGSADPYSPKVLRASMGASLYIPIRIGDHQDLLNVAQKASFQLYVADAHGTPVNKASFNKPFMLILGNESKGSTLKHHIDSQAISLPIQQVDSLNVAIAGSLLMYVTGGSHEN